MGFFFDEATEGELARFLAVLDCLTPEQMKSMMRWAAQGGEYFLGNARAVASLEKDAARRDTSCSDGMEVMKWIGP